MKTQITTLLVTGCLLLLAGLAPAQDALPQIRPAEFFPCTFNEGKDMGDLEKVIARWNATARGSTGRSRSGCPTGADAPDRTAGALHRALPPDGRPNLDRC